MTENQKNKVLLIQDRLNVASLACEFMADYLEGEKQLDIFLPSAMEYCKSPQADIGVKDFVYKYAAIAEQLKTVFPAVMECIHEFVENTARKAETISISQ